MSALSVGVPPVLFLLLGMVVKPPIRPEATPNADLSAPTVADMSAFSGPSSLIVLAKAPNTTGCCASSPSIKKPKTVSPPTIRELSPKQPCPDPEVASTRT